MHAVAFAAGKVLYSFLLIRTAEIEAPNVGPRLRFEISHLDELLVVRNFFPHSPVTFEAIATLVYTGQLHGRTKANFPAVGLFLTGEHAE